jgi:hypothetical protein
LGPAPTSYFRINEIKNFFDMKNEIQERIMGNDLIEEDKKKEKEIKEESEKAKQCCRKKVEEQTVA